MIVLMRIMQRSSLNSFLNICIKYAIYIVTLVLIVTFLLTLYNNFEMILAGQYDTAFEWFTVLDYSIKISAALFALIAVYLTLQKMEQTELTQRIASDNNNFNNFLKHRDEFLRRIKNTFMQHEVIQREIKEQVIDEHLMNLYHFELYSSSYNNFSPNLNQTAKNKINNFINSLNDIISNPLFAPFSEVTSNRLHEAIKNNLFNEISVFFSIMLKGEQTIKPSKFEKVGYSQRAAQHYKNLYIHTSRITYILYFLKCLHHFDASFDLNFQEIENYCNETKIHIENPTMDVLPNIN